MKRKTPAWQREDKPTVCRYDRHDVRDTFYYCTTHSRTDDGSVIHVATAGSNVVVAAWDENDSFVEFERSRWDSAMVQLSEMRFGNPATDEEVNAAVQRLKDMEQDLESERPVPSHEPALLCRVCGGEWPCNKVRTDSQTENQLLDQGS